MFYRSISINIFTRIENITTYIYSHMQGTADDVLHRSVPFSQILWHYKLCQWGRRLEGWPNTAVRLAGWRRVALQVWCCMWWMGRTACLFHAVPVALTGAAQLLTDWNSSCCYIVNVHNHPSWATSRKEGMDWHSSRPMPSLWLWLPTVPSAHVSFHGLPLLGGGGGGPIKNF